MYRAALRPAGRVLSRHASAASRRFASTSPVDRPRSWKSSALRWGLAGAAVYYYSTSSVFAEEPAHLTSPAPSHFSDEDLPTVDSVIEEKRKQIQDRLESKNVVRETPSSNSAPAIDNAKQPGETEAGQPQHSTTAAEGSAAALEEEAGQQGAFNPETGEINWDCPCLGGMAHGPCGEEFKTAFSCFVYSDAEPKGMDCIDKFQGMQDCFRQHPDVYGAELAEDDAAEEAAEQHAEQHATRTDVNSDTGATADIGEPDVQQLRDSAPISTHNDAKAVSEGASATIPESDPFPTKWDDATAANDAVKVETPKQKEDEQKPEKKETA